MYTLSKIQINNSPILTPTQRIKKVKCGRTAERIYIKDGKRSRKRRCNA